MKNTHIAASLAAIGLISVASAVPINWTNGSGDGLWGTGGNWSGGGVPNLDGTDDAIISNGNTVLYVPGGDLTVATGSALNISGGSAWQQVPSNWTRFNGGSMALDNGTFQRSGGNVVLGFDNGTGANVTLDNAAAINLGGELWFGRNDGSFTNQVVSVTVAGGSSITATGSVGIWFWDTDASGNDLNLDFTAGPVVSEVGGRVGRRNSGGSNNSINWETLWNEGILTIDGGNLGDFADHFTTSGTPGNSNYSLQTIAVPDPGSTAPLLGFSGLALLLLKRKSK